VIAHSFKMLKCCVLLWFALGKYEQMFYPRFPPTPLL
jgi:hypothetical protein